MFNKFDAKFVSLALDESRRKKKIASLSSGRIISVIGFVLACINSMDPKINDVAYNYRFSIMLLFMIIIGKIELEIRLLKIVDVLARRDQSKVELPDAHHVNP